MIKNYLKIAWRNILKYKGFSLVNIGGLALGMASCLLLMLYVNYHLTFDTQFKDIDRVYTVENNQKGDGKTYTFASTPRLAATFIKSEIPEAVEAVRVVDYGGMGLLTYNNQRLKKAGMFTDDGFFNVLTYQFIKGNPQTALKSPSSIIITESLVKALFKDENPLGKIITRNNQVPFTVTGVIADPPANSTYHFDYMMPWVQFEAANTWAKTSGWGSNFSRTLVKLKDPSALNKANGILGKLIARQDPGNTNQLFLYPFGKLHLYGRFEDGKVTGGLISQIQLFITLAVCLLLIACVNFMNLSTARSEERAKEVGIRKAIGSGRTLLIGQFMTESLILSMLSTIIAAALVAMTLPYFNTLLSVQISLPLTNPLAWLVLLGIGLLTGVIAGSYPAFYLSSFEPIKVLKGFFKGGGSALSLRKVLVVVQFSFAVFLITATICIYYQLKYVQAKPIGFDKNNLVEIPVEGTLQTQSAALINELKQAGAITSGTTLSQSITQSGSNSWGVTWPGKPDNQQILFDILHGGNDFTKTAGLKLLEGREFSSSNAADTARKTVMINETAAKVMHLKNTIGAVIKWGDQPATIIGIYKDFVWGSPYSKIAPMISMYNSPGDVIDLRLNPAKSITANIEIINKTLKSINPAFPPHINFVDSDFEAKFQNEKLLGTLANVFGGLAIFISCLGLFGLAAYAAEQRIKEIGVRKVLGASVIGLTTLLSKDFLKLVLIAIVLAIPVSFYSLNQWLQKFEYRISISWWMLVMAGLATVVIAIATVSYQALKASLANPVKSLRSE